MTWTQRVCFMRTARNRPRPNVISPRTVVMLHPGGLGDLLLAVPAIRALREQLPSNEFLLCAHPQGGELLQECGLVDRWLSAQSTGCMALFGGMPPGDSLLRGWLSRCDLAVAWTSDGSGTLAAALKRSGAAVAVVESPFASTLSSVHQSDRYAETVGVHSSQASISHTVSKALRAGGQTYLSGNGLSRRKPLAIIHPGSGSRHKCVKPEILLEVLEGLEGFEWLLLQGPADKEMVERLLLRMPRPPIVLRGLPMRLLAGILLEAKVFIGHDSGVTHLAAFLGIPTIALFGPTNPARWAPRGPAVTVIREHTCRCSTWDGVSRCHDQPCLELSAPAILTACMRAVPLP
jgi:heptosyltransferase III